MSRPTRRLWIAVTVLSAGCTLRDYRLDDAGADVTREDNRADGSFVPPDDARTDAGDSSLDVEPADTMRVDVFETGAPDGPPSDDDAAPPMDVMETDAIDVDAFDGADVGDALDAPDATPPDEALPLSDTPAPSDVSDVPPARDVVDVTDSAPTCALTRCGAACVDLATDPANCGTCGMACTGATNGVPACVSRACSVRCNAGFALNGGACVAIPAPRPVWPPSGSVSTSARPSFRWALAAGNTGAVVEICTTRACPSAVQRVPATGTSVALPTALPPGRYFWRLLGRNDTAEGTLASAPWQFTVERTTAPAVSSVWGQRFDFNGDGLPDVATGVETSATPRYGVRVSLNRGTSVHDATPAAYATDSELFGIAAGGDFNGDGFGDVAAVLPEGTGSIIRVFSGNAAQTPGGALVSRTPIVFGDDSIGGDLRIASVGDVDGDGYADLVGYVHNGNLLIRLWRGSSAGLQTTFTALTDSSTSGRATIAGVGDVDADGRSDFAVSFVNGGASLWYGGATPVRGPLFDNPGGIASECSVAAAGDVNGDGYPDMLLASSQSTTAAGQGIVIVYTGGGTRPPAVPLRANIVEVDPDAGFWNFGTAAQGIGDVNSDGSDDIAVLSTRSDTHEERLVVFSGRDTTAAPLADVALGSASLEAGQPPVLVGPGSIDGNASPDVLVGSSGDLTGPGTVRVLLAPFALATSRTLAPPAMASRYGGWLARYATPTAGERAAHGWRSASARGGL